MNMNEYQVGQVENQSADDPAFDNYEKAIAAAKLGSWNDAVWAVWRMPDGDIQALVYQQTVFESVM